MSAADRYPVPARLHRVEEVIRRSRFITTVARAPDPDAAHAFIERIRREFPDATHNCWAFVAGPPGDTARVGMSDDGEPHGTAGRPMLTTLLHGGVGEIVAVCTRYFGGVKLGTGGLGRAYAGGVRLALETLPTVERVDFASLEVRLSYPHLEGVRRLVAEAGGEVDDETFEADVLVRCRVPVSGVEAFRAAVEERTRGAGGVRERPAG